MSHMPLVMLMTFIVLHTTSAFEIITSCQQCNYTCIPSPENQFLCYNAKTTYPVYIIDNRMWYNMQEYDFCFKLKNQVLENSIKLCARATIFDLYCAPNTTCLYNSTTCSDGTPYTREYRCPIWYKDYHIYGPAILLPVLGLYTTVTLILLCLRRSYFPIRVKSIPALAMQFAAGLSIVFFISMLRYIPCGLAYFGVFLSSPLYVAFITTRVCLCMHS